MSAHGGGQSAVLWSQGGLRVWARWDEGGDLVIEGQDLGPRLPAGAREYEYAHRVAAVDVPAVVAALGGGQGDDVLALLVEHAGTVVGGGEGRWLTQAGVSSQFWSHLDVD